MEQVTKDMTQTKLLMDSPGTAAMAQAFYQKEYGGQLCPHVTFGALSKQRSMRDKLNDSDDAGEDDAQVSSLLRVLLRFFVCTHTWRQAGWCREKCVAKMPRRTHSHTSPLEIHGRYTW